MELKEQIQEVLERYPSLNYNEVDNSIFGELSISKGDSYDVSMNLNPYPKNFPLVFETGERIPKKITRHIYSNTNSCCLSTQAKAQILLKTKICTLYLFVKEIVVPYFQNNSYFEINGRYLTEEYSHDKRGIIEGYRDILKTNNDYLIAKLIVERINGMKLRLHDLCYCGNGLIVKKCNHSHFNCYKDFRKIDTEVLQHDISVFMELLKM